MKEFLATLRREERDDNLMITLGQSLHTSELFQVFLVDPTREKLLVVVTVGAVAILMITGAPILICRHSSVVLVSPLLPVRLEAQPVPGVAVGGVGHLVLTGHSLLCLLGGCS